MNENPTSMNDFNETRSLDTAEIDWQIALRHG